MPYASNLEDPLRQFEEYPDDALAYAAGSRRSAAATEGAGVVGVGW